MTSNRLCTVIISHHVRAQLDLINFIDVCIFRRGAVHVWVETDKSTKPYTNHREGYKKYIVSLMKIET